MAKLWAKTQIGALRGLETFSQLVTFGFEQRAYRIEHAPWLIIDSPVIFVMMTHAVCDLCQESRDEVANLITAELITCACLTVRISR